MNKFMKSATYLLFLLLLKHVKSQEYVGDSCSVSGKSGQCRLISNCPEVLRALQRRIPPKKTCGYIRQQPIVCCEETTISTTARYFVPTTKSTPRTVSHQQCGISSSQTPLNTFSAVGDKSKQKCREYGHCVYSRPVAVGVIGQSERNTDECAIVAVENIVGGVAAKPKEFPHMALIGFDEGDRIKIWKCGGSLISDKFVLTAAHCLYSQSEIAKYVRLGELVLGTTADDAMTQDFNIINNYYHPNYKAPSKYNDIALLELNREARLNAYVRPACLNTNRNIDNPRSIASGWGGVGIGGTGGYSNELLKVTLEEFSSSECYDSYKININSKLRNGIVEETQICAGSRNESRDTCSGDSGGPLQISNSMEVYCTYKIIGITSFGKVCGTINVPGVYTRVSAYIKWIEDIVWP